MKHQQTQKMEEFEGLLRFRRLQKIFIPNVMVPKWDHEVPKPPMIEIIATLPFSLRKISS